jgi:hypothetical protein
LRPEDRAQVVSRFETISGAKNVKKHAIFNHFRAQSRPFSLIFVQFRPFSPAATVGLWFWGPGDDGGKGAGKTRYFNKKGAPRPQMFHVEHNKNTFRAAKLPPRTPFSLSLLPKAARHKRKSGRKLGSKLAIQTKMRTKSVVFRRYMTRQRRAGVAGQAHEYQRRGGGHQRDGEKGRRKIGGDNIGVH